MLSFARKRPVAAHFLLSLAIASGVIVFSIAMAVLQPSSATAMAELSTNIIGGPSYANLVTISQEAAKRPILLAIFVFASAPTVAALILAAAGAGGGLRRLLSRLKPVGPEGDPRRAAGLYLGLLAVYAAGLFFYDWVAGPGVDGFTRLGGLGGGVILGAVMGLFLDEGGTLEELGWRGFAWPLLQASIPAPLLAALVLGALHWAWHLPREVPNLLGGAALGAWASGQAMFLVLCVALSVIAGFCVNRAGGSVWPAIFVHGGTNVWSKAMYESAAPTFGVDLRTILVVLIAVVVAVFAGRRLGRAPAPA